MTQPLSEWAKARRNELPKENRQRNRKRLAIKYRQLRKVNKRIKRDLKQQGKDRRDKNK